VLNHFTFQLPPDGNIQSMDSAIYLASIFVFGLNFTLDVLFVSSFIFALYHRALIKSWWKHFINFGIYVIMVMITHFTFAALGGTTGSIAMAQLYSYLVALFVYFAANVLLVGTYYFLSMKDSFFTVIKGVSKQTLVAYFSTLFLSLILTILLYYYNMFGLFIFLCVATMISYAFKQFFDLYNEISEKAIKDQRTGLYLHGYFEERLEE